MSKKTDDLRKRAEKKIPKSAGSIGKMSPPKIQKLVHELDVQQIELEMQNEELRKSQEETAESQHKYSDLYDFAPVGYFTFNKKGHIIEANLTGASLLGMEKRSLAKQSFQRFIVPGHLGVFQSHLQKAHETRSKQTCKLKLAGKEGTPFDALMDTIAVIDDEGKFVYYLSSVTDITDITRTERELREIEARYQAIFDGAIEGIFRTSLLGKNIVANPALARILGYDSAEDVVLAIEDSARQVWSDPNERSRFVRLLEEQGTVRGYECQFKKKDGTKIWVSLNSRAVRGTDGQVVYFDGFIEDISERKQVEDTLRESEARLSLSTEAVGAGLWIMNVDTGSVWVSPKSRELFHFAPDEEIHYESYFRVIHPDDRERVHQEVQHALRSGANLHCDYRIVLPDGSIRWIVVRGQRFMESTKEPPRMIGLSFDITERKEMELQLSESQTLLSSLINSTSDMIWSVDAETFGLLTFNRGLYEYFRHQRGIQIEAGMRPEDLFTDEEYIQRWRSFYQQALDEGSFTTEYLVHAGTRTLRLNLNILKDDDRVFGVSVFGQDITERKQAEAALRESERRMRDITFSMADWVWEVDENGVYTYSSSKGDELFGHVLGKTPFDFMPPDEAKKVAAIFSEIVKNKAPIKDLENWNIRKNGEMICLLTNGVPILDEEGNLKGYRGVDKDITERKRMETQLRDHLQEIEVLKLQLERENIYLREELRDRQGFEKIVGNSDALNYILFRVGQVAPTDATVLILGETGTGKGMVANAIHGLSGRKDRPMITVNCAALPANLIESELFGREKGAFTGAHVRQAGRFEVADGGTIFLDEIGELPLDLQSKLLRVLQDGEFERLGSAKTVKVDVRVIASTSRDLKDEIKAGRFRQDLFYRLNVFPVSIPPLRKRTDDVPELVRFFVDKYARKAGKRIENISKTAMQSLQEYSWPGNVRELEHVIERAVIITEGAELQIIDRLEPHEDSAESDAPLKDLAAMEREHILRVLRETHWKIEGAKGAAAILNLNPSTLRFRIKKLGIERD